MKLAFRPVDLILAHRWTISRRLQPDGSGGANAYKVVFVELTDRDGVVGSTSRYSMARRARQAKQFTTNSASVSMRTNTSPPSALESTSRTSSGAKSRKRGLTLS